MDDNFTKIAISIIVILLIQEKFGRSDENDINDAILFEQIKQV
jgi:hypothetical protein